MESLVEKLITINKEFKLIQTIADVEFLFLDYIIDGSLSLEQQIDNSLKWAYNNDDFEDFFGEEDGITFISNRMVKPSYYDILIEANKSIVITGDYHHTFLEGLNHIPNNNLLEYSGIRPNRNIDYYEFILGS